MGNMTDSTLPYFCSKQFDWELSLFVLVMCVIYLIDRQHHGPITYCFNLLSRMYGRQTDLSLWYLCCWYISSFMEYDHVYMYNFRIVMLKQLDQTNKCSPLCWYRISKQLLRLPCSLTVCLDALAVVVKLFIQPHVNCKYDNHLYTPLLKHIIYMDEFHGLDLVMYLDYLHMLCKLGFRSCLMYRFRPNRLIIVTAKELHAICLRLSFKVVLAISLLSVYFCSATLMVHGRLTYNLSVHYLLYPYVDL